MATMLAAFDGRPFFERALHHGVASGLIDTARLARIEADFAKGVVQIAHYFGTEYLRPELELALQRMVTLMSLYLEDLADGDERIAAASLRDHSLLAHSKAGSDMLRRLIAMPDSSSVLAAAPTLEQQRAWLDERTAAHPYTLAQYRAELARRQAHQTTLDCARWLAERMGAARDDLIDADALIRTALLVLFVDKAALRLPTRTGFVQLVNAARRAKATLNHTRIELFLAAAPAAIGVWLHAAMTRFVAHDLARLRALDTSADALLYGEAVEPFFVVESLDDDASEYDRLVAKEWHRATRGEADDPQVLATLLLLLATGQPPKASLLLKDAKAVTRAFRENGFDDAAVSDYVARHAPESQREDVLRFWHDELAAEARDALADTDPDWPDTHMERALAYLRNTCRARWKARR
jgi:hypothetical protein